MAYTLYTLTTLRAGCGPHGWPCAVSHRKVGPPSLPAEQQLTHHFPSNPPDISTLKPLANNFLTPNVVGVPLSL